MKSRANKIQIRKVVALTFASVIASIFASGLMANVATAQQKKPIRKFGPGQNTSPAKALQQQKKGPPPKIIAKNGKWVVQCDSRKTPDGKKAPCVMVQVVRSKEKKNIAITLIFVKAKQGDKVATMMRVLAPIGVFLPTGIALEIDGKPVGRVPFTRCLPQTCMAFAAARPETLAKMKKGTKGRFLIYQAPGVGIPLELDLTGFTASLAALDSTL